MKRSWTVLAAVVGVSVVLGLASCVPVPLGDSEKAKVDRRLLGAWKWVEGEQTNLVVMRAWDERTYVAETWIYTGNAAKPVPKERVVFKGWVAEVKGEVFLNLQQTDMLDGLGGEKGKYFIVARVKVAGDRLTATGLDGGYAKFKGVGTSTELERVVGENMEDAMMWAKPVEATRVGEEEVGRVVGAFGKR